MAYRHVICLPSLEPMHRVGQALAERRCLAAGVDAESFAAARAYAGRMRPHAPYELLCPGVVRLRPEAAARLERDVMAGAAGSDFIAAFGATVLGPLVAGFAHWAWRQWRGWSDGAGPAAVMRDGALLGRALERLAGPVPQVWLSRPLCLLGAVAAADDRGALLNLLVRARHRAATVAEGLGDLGLAGEAVPGVSESAPLVGDALERTLAWLAGTPAIAARVDCGASLARRAILEHLRGSGAFRGERLGLIDVGYSGTIQRCLSRIALIEDVRVRTLGLYLATSPGAVWTAGRRAMVRGFVLRYGAPDWLAGPLIGSRAVLELMLGAAQGPLIGYDRGVPRCAPAEYPPAQQAAMQRLQEAALAGCGRPLGRGAAQSLLARLLGAPTAEEVRHFGCWTYGDRLSVDGPRSLADLWRGAGALR